jgi:alkaline phosphatase D
MSSELRPSRRTFLAGAGATLAAAKFAQGGGEEPKLTHGPFTSFLDERTLGVWARASAAGEYTFTLFDDSSVFDGSKKLRALAATALASIENDFTLHWKLEGVESKLNGFTPSIDCQHKPIWPEQKTWYPRGPGDGEAIVIGSCADDHKFADQLVWKQIRESNPGCVVLIGDTPYIDSTDLEIQRCRYREFFAQPQMAETLRAIPFYATWDDHDYAGNDLFGDIKGREHSRQAFLEYHPPGEYGENGHGIYSKFRRGSTEVFLLDTRWFADIEPSPFDATKKSLLGAAQWAWLQKALSESTATFKLLVCGMVWNGAVRGGKKDCWGNWPHERDALFAWIGRNKVSGVVLVGGDLHRSRALRHPTKAVAGYDIVELITSPLANTIIDSNDVADPALIFDKGVEQSFLRLTPEKSPAGETLHAAFIDGAGQIFGFVDLDSHTLRAH